VTAQARSVPAVPAAAIIAIAVLAALVTGRLFAEGHVPVALAIVVATAYLPLLFLDFQAALALWAGMLFVAHLSALTVAPRAIAALLVVGWLTGCVLVRNSDRLPVLSQHRALTGCLVLFVAWLGLTRIWSLDPGLSEVELTYWAYPLTLVVIAMTINSLHGVRLIGIAMLVGAAVSVLVGLANGSATAGAEAASLERFTAGGADPNTQAAGYLAAICVTAGLLGVVRRSGARIAVIAAAMLVTFGFFATQSRGGIVGLGVAALVALIVTPRYRARILGLIAVVAVGLGAFLSSNDAAFQRLTDAEGAGNEREDIWTVAWQIFLDHPLLGTGLQSFQAVSPRYVLDSGPLANVRLIAESPHLVHNIFLELLAETGIVGLALFTFVVIACLRASWLAARRFDALGRNDYANLARAVMVATVGMLVAGFFLSNMDDFRMWILLGLGPVLLTIARQGRAESRPHVVA
jgi:O-antigen ligase